MDRWFSQELQMSRSILKMHPTPLVVKTTLRFYLAVVRMAITKRKERGSWSNAQWLRALAALPDGLSLIPNTLFLCK